MQAISARLEAIKSLCEKATCGEWYVTTAVFQPNNDRVFVRSREGLPDGCSKNHAVCEAFGGTGPRPQDAAFIAASRSLVPALVAALEERLTHTKNNRCGSLERQTTRPEMRLPAFRN